MSRRKLIGAVAFYSLLLIALAIHYVADIPQDEWPVLWKIALAVAVCAAFVMAFYDRKNLPKKVWDFNPKRGFLYFLLGWFIFPFGMAVDAIFGADLSLGTMVVGTLCLSVLIGVAGTFTENVGV